MLSALRTPRYLRHPLHPLYAHRAGLRTLFVGSFLCPRGTHRNVEQPTVIGGAADAKDQPARFPPLPPLTTSGLGMMTKWRIARS